MFVHKNRHAPKLSETKLPCKTRRLKQLPKKNIRLLMLAAFCSLTKKYLQLYGHTEINPQNHWPYVSAATNKKRNSSGDEIANVIFLRPHRTILQKYNPLLNIQHDAGRGAASGCGLVVLVRRFSHAPICCNEVRCLSHSSRISLNNRGVPHFNAFAGGDPLRISP